MRLATIASMASVMVAGLSRVQAGRARMTMTADDRDSTWKFGEIKLNFDRYDDDRNQPYRVVFFKDGVRSLFYFKSDFLVKRFVVDDVTYKVVYDESGGIKKVRTDTSTRRDLAEIQAPDEADIFEGSHRLLMPDTFACEDCYEMWSVMCDGIAYRALADLDESGETPAGAASLALEYVKQGIYWACYFNFDHDTDRRFDVACDGQCI